MVSNLRVLSLRKFKAVIDKQLKVAEGLVGKGVKKKDVYANIMKTAREKAPPPKPRKQQPRPPAVRQKVALQQNPKQVLEPIGNNRSVVRF